MVLKESLCGYSNLSLRYITQWRARQNKTVNNMVFFSTAAYAMGIVWLSWVYVVFYTKMSFLSDNYGKKLLEVSERASCALD